MSIEINHHVTDALLMSYAAGTLEEGFSLVLAAHISLCDECRARLGSFEAVGGALVDSCGVVEMGDDALDATFALIDAAPDEEGVVKAAPDSVFPTPLREYVGGDLDKVRWRSVVGGVQQAILKTKGQSKVRLLSIPGGTAIPDHGHRGLELTLVLKGAFEDEDGVFARGDVEVANEDLHHTPVACEGEACICLAATDAPLRFKGLIPRIVQPFLGI